MFNFEWVIVETKAFHLSPRHFLSVPYQRSSLSRLWWSHFLLLHYTHNYIIGVRVWVWVWIAIPPLRVRFQPLIAQPCSSALSSVCASLLCALNSCRFVSCVRIKDDDAVPNRMPMAISRLRAQHKRGTAMHSEQARHSEAHHITAGLVDWTCFSTNISIIVEQIPQPVLMRSVLATAFVRITYSLAQNTALDCHPTRPTTFSIAIFQMPTSRWVRDKPRQASTVEQIA